MKIEDIKPFKDLLIKMEFSRAVLSKALKILDTLNIGPVWNYLIWKNIILRDFFCNKWNLLTELVFCAKTSEA